MRDGLIKKALKDSNFYFISQLGVRLLSVLIVPYLARHTTPTELGNYDLFLVFVGLLTTLVGLGIDSGMSIFIANHKDNFQLQRSLFSFSFWVTIVVIFVLYLLFFFWSFLGQVPVWVPSGDLIHLSFVYLLITYINYIIFNFLRWKGLAGKAALSSFLASSLGLVGGIIWFNYSNGVISDYLLGLTFGALLSLPYSLFLIKGFLVFRIPREHRGECKELLRVSLPFVPNYLSNNLMLVVDRFVINRILGIETLGQYALLSRFAQLPNFAMNIVTKGFQPVMFLNYESPEGIRLNKLVYHVFLVMLPIAVALSGFTGKWLLQLFGGSQYLSVAHLLPSVVASTLIYGGMGINGMGYTIQKKTKYLVLISILTIGCNLLLNYLSLTDFGFSGLAISAPATSAVGALIYTWKSERLYSFGLSFWGAVVSYVITVFCAMYFSFYF